jgi:uncharacterized protein (TIGR03790 family)
MVDNRDDLIKVIILLVLAGCGPVFALEPNEILVVVNTNLPESTGLGRYYCQKRGVPYENILYLHLGKSLSENISREAYEERMAQPVRRELLRKRVPGQIKCLLTTYGVPTRVGTRGPLKEQQSRLKELEELIKQTREKIEQLEQTDPNHKGSVSEEVKKNRQAAAILQLEIDRINGKETNASVDSELSLALAGDYDLYRWQPNRLRINVLDLDFQTLMVSRLDGPNEEIALGLVDKAIAAEKTGLKGIAYVDSRGIKSEKSSPYGHFDQSLRDLAILTGLRTALPVKEERTGELFAPGSCPQAAVYCGWYSLKKYVDAFDFVDGAVGYHIASFEAVGLHDPNSPNWCPAMLRDGITATLGAVAEPYLHAFPEPKAFFGQLYDGKCLVEAYYRTNPFNSWQLLLIGDPLYRPFARRQLSSGDGS